MADNLAEAIELVKLYQEKTAEQAQGLAELQQTLEGWTAQTAALLGEGHETPEGFATAATATNICVGLMASTASELGELERVLGELT